MLGPAALVAAAGGRRHRAAWCACPRDRRPPTSCSPSPSCCASTASSASSSSSTAKASAGSRSRTGRRSATCRPSTARRARSSRSTTRRCATCRATGRPDDLVALVEAYAKEQGLWHDPSARPVYDETLVLDLSTVEPSLAGPARPQDRVALVGARDEFEKALLAFRQLDRATRIRTSRSASSPAAPTTRRPSRSPRAIRPRPRKA